MRDGGFVNLLKASPVWHTRAMNTPATPNRYKHHRFPGEIISHGVWLYDRFYLSYRDVEELLFERGVIVTYEAIRKWCRKFHIPSILVVTPRALHDSLEISTCYPHRVSSGYET